jgi:hypothetical protein
MGSERVDVTERRELVTDLTDLTVPYGSRVTSDVVCSWRVHRRACNRDDTLLRICLDSIHHLDSLL